MPWPRKSMAYGKSGKSLYKARQDKVVETKWPGDRYQSRWQGTHYPPAEATVCQRSRFDKPDTAPASATQRPSRSSGCIFPRIRAILIRAVLELIQVATDYCALACSLSKDTGV